MQSKGNGRGSHHMTGKIAFGPAAQEGMGSAVERAGVKARKLAS